jgi:hypothetical protein
MAQDAIDHAGIGNKGNEVHAAAAGAQQGIRLEDFPDSGVNRIHPDFTSVEDPSVWKRKTPFGGIE